MQCAVCITCGSTDASKIFRIKVHNSPQSMILDVLNDDLDLTCDDFNVRWTIILSSSNVKFSRALLTCNTRLGTNAT